jgi:hypothetical protein
MTRAVAAVRYAFTGNTEWFGPMQPLAPMAPEEVRGRQYDYPVGANLTFSPRSGEPVGFAKLKNLAASSDLLRSVIEGQKDKIEALEWSIKPREKLGHNRGIDRSVLDIQAQLEYPGPHSRLGAVAARAARAAVRA